LASASANPLVAWQSSGLSDSASLMSAISVAVSPRRLATFARLLTASGRVGSSVRALRHTRSASS
jgi:hypothetical protein